MSEIIFKTVTPESPDKDLVEAIYCEAFPERERTISFEGLLYLGQVLESSRVMAAYEDEKIIGFMDYFEYDEYVYLMFFAVNSQLRGGGYGSKLIRSFLNMFPEKVVIGSIETPIPGTSNYDQRIKRKVFYDRVNLLMTKYSFGPDGEHMLTLMSSRQDARNAEYIALFFEALSEMMNCLSGSEGVSAQALEEIKFYRTENGKMTQVSATDWLI